ncbi:MAG: hypothetical protein V6Z81_06495 [Parvularculales bacterium]
MSNAFTRDANARVSSIRGGSVIGGKYDPSGLTANTWYRLMPSGNNAQKVAATVADFDRQLNLGTLRSDISNASLIGWRLKILNTGYQQSHVIFEHTGGVVRLESPIRHFAGLGSTGIEYVIYPEVLNPLVVYCAGANTVEFGRSEDEAYSLSKVDAIGDVDPGKMLVFPYAALDKLCFRYATVGSTDRLSWGEHYIA